MRCLGIDYGTRRVGLAYGDELGVAFPLPALTDPDPDRRWIQLGVVIRERRITDLVLGLPLNMDGSAGPKVREVEAYAERLRADFGLPVHLEDERLTSHEAEESIAPAQRRGVRASGIVDSRAAAILLSEFLEARLGLPPASGDEP